MRIIREQKRNKNLYKKHKHVILSSSCIASKQIFFRLLINSCVLKAVNLLDNLDASTVIITIMVFHANVSWCHHWNRGPLRSREPLLSSRFHEPNWTKHMDTPFFLSASLSSTAPFVWYHQIFYQHNSWVNFYNLFFADLLVSSDCSLCAHGSLVIFHVVCVGHSTLLPTESFSEVFTKWSHAFSLLSLECSAIYTLCTHWDSFHSLQALLFFPSPTFLPLFPLSPSTGTYIFFPVPSYSLSHF